MYQVPPEKQKKLDPTKSMTYFSCVELKEKLKAKRAELGLTQVQAAKEWGIPAMTLSQWEQGRRTPRGLALRQLEQILSQPRQPSD